MCVIRHIKDAIWRCYIGGVAASKLHSEWTRRVELVGVSFGQGQGGEKAGICLRGLGQHLAGITAKLEAW